MNELAQAYQGARDFLFLGRGTNYPIALEGALKLKEISYIHAEGYAAGEMKHGPIALIDDGVPVVVIAPQGTGLREGAVEPRRGAGPQRARHRGGHRGRQRDRPASPSGCSRSRTRRPRCSRSSPCCRCQIMSYAIALAKGNDVDQPRNLAKSVTVE